VVLGHKYSEQIDTMLYSLYRLRYRKLRVDKQQQVEGMCMELKAANSKGNSRQLFEISKSISRKFQPHLQCIQSATGENLTEAEQIADRYRVL